MKKIFTLTVLSIGLINFQNVNAKDCRVGMGLENMGFPFWISNTISYDTLCIPGTVINFHANIHISDEGVCYCSVSSTSWYHNGLLISSADTCMITDTGSYLMQSGINDCGIMTYTFNLHVGYSTSTGISGTNPAEGFALYPSNSNGSFKIKTSGKNLRRILIFNSAGQSVLSIEKDLSEINLADYSAGIYFYAITDEKENVWRGKVIKD